MKLLFIRILIVFMPIITLNGLTTRAQDFGKIDSLLYLVETARDDSIRVTTLIEISREFARADIQKALQFGEKALDFAEKSSDKVLLANALFNMGIVTFDQGILDVSIKYFYRYLELKKETEDERGAAGGYINIGAVYLQLNQYEQAGEFFGKALDYYEKLPFDEVTFTPNKQLITIYNNLGIVSQRMEDLDLAVDYYSRGISLARRTPDNQRMLAMLLNNLGSVYIEKKQPEQAFAYLSEAFEIRQNNGDLYGMVQSYRMIADHYIRIDEDEKALEQLRLGYDLAGKVGNLTTLAQIIGKMHEIYDRKQIIDSAYKYHVLLSGLNDTLNREAAIKELKHLEITSQLKENERILQLEQKRKEQWYLIIGISLILSLVILSLLFFLTHSRNRRLKLEKEVIDLNSKNLELEKISLEKELDVKNKELTTNVMYQIQKNELISEIVEKLQKQSVMGKKTDQNWLLEIVRDLEKTQEQAVWNEFEIRFQQVNNEFYNKLNEINPDLSVNERRLCAFLSLNMTTKEISSITGQSPRTIDVARTRLRKKLNLTNSEVGLVEFLASI